MIVPPTMYDNPQATVFIDRGEIVGVWAFALGSAHFQVAEYAGRQLPDGSGSKAPVSFHHDSGVRP
jgi:hypothetical protein